MPTAHTPLRVVVLTIGGAYGVQVLRALHARGRIPAAVLVEANTALRACFHARTTGGRVKELPLVPLRALWRHLRPRTRRDLRIGAPVVVTGPLNSARMGRDLARLRPDLLLLAGTRIVSAELLAIPRLGTLNVHLGLLPWVRGSDVIAHSILNGVALGATCHLVDPGIDTGPIIRRQLLDVRGIEPSLVALEAASVGAGATLFADVVADAITAAQLPPATPQTERFPLHRFLPAERRGEADALIQLGVARTLYEEWAGVERPSFAAPTTPRASARGGVRPSGRPG